MLFLPRVLCPLQVDKVTGRFNGQFKTYAICGAIRRMVSLWFLSDTGETPRLACQLVRWLLSSRGRFNLDRIKRRFCFFSAVGTNFQCVCWLETPWSFALPWDSSECFISSCRASLTTPSWGWQRMTALWQSKNLFSKFSKSTYWSFSFCTC